MIETKLLIDNTRDLNLLYVEDDEKLSSVTKELLSVYFNSIDTAFNGLDGLEKYKKFLSKHGRTYDLVITDINMPEMNGIKMSQEILALNEIQTIVMITAFDSQKNLKEAISLGIDGFIYKPMQTKELFRILFKVSRIISDRKMIERHIEQIENLNLELLEANNELKKSSRMLDTVIDKEINSTKSNLHTMTSAESANIDDEVQGQIKQLINEDLFELKEILLEIDVNIIAILHNIENISEETLESLIKNFSRYSAILHFYTFFNELSLAMSNFVDIMKNVPLPSDKESVNNIFIFLETFVYVLSKWQEDISLGDANKLNQLDSSLISDMNTIINIWIVKEEESSSADLDDIFDF